MQNFSIRFLFNSRSSNHVHYRIISSTTKYLSSKTTESSYKFLQKRYRENIQKENTENRKWLATSQQTQIKGGKLQSSLLQHPLHYVLPNHSLKLKPTSSIVRANNGKMPVMGVGPSGFRRSHNHSNSRKGFRPYICWGDKGMPTGFPIKTSWSGSLNAISILVGGFRYTRGGTMIGWWFSRWGYTDLSGWFHSVKPSQNPVTKVSPNFYVSLLYSSVNIKYYIKHSTCSSVKTKRGAKKLNTTMEENIGAQQITKQ